MSGINADWNGTSIDKLRLTAAWLARLMVDAAQARQALITLAITLERREPDATTPATPGDGAGVSRDVNLMTAETSATIVKLRPGPAPATGSASTKAKPGPAKATRSMSAKDWQSFRSQVRAEMKARAGSRRARPDCRAGQEHGRSGPRSHEAAQGHAAHPFPEVVGGRGRGRAAPGSAGSECADRRHVGAHQPSSAEA